MKYTKSEVGSWFRYLDSIGAKHITEIECKDQFNKIKPAQVVSHLASQWLTCRKQRRASELIWSFHKEQRKLDRVGKDALGKFWYLGHEDLVKMVSFELTENIHV